MRTCFFVKTREHENKREGWRLDWAKRICQHSARFLPTFVWIHEFGSAYVCAKYWEKHWHEWLMHVLGHLREQKLHAFGAFSEAWHSWSRIHADCAAAHDCASCRWRSRWRGSGRRHRVWLLRQGSCRYTPDKKYLKIQNVWFFSVSLRSFVIFDFWLFGFSNFI